MQSGKLSFSNRFIVYLWTGVNDAKTLRVDANFFENGEKRLRFQTNTDTCRRGLRNFGRDKMVRTYIHVSGCQESAPADVKC